MFIKECSGRRLFDGLPSDHPATRIRAFAGLAGGSKTVGTGKPENATFPFGQIISKPVKKASRRCRSVSGIDRPTGIDRSAGRAARKTQCGDAERETHK
jgi:hypothetical protein